MKYKLETVRYAQGWLDSQLRAMNEAAVEASPDPDNSVLEFHNAVKTMENIMAQWAVVDQSMDELLKENFDLKRQLTLVKNAVTPPDAS